MGYGGGWQIGDRIEIVRRDFFNASVHYATPPTLVGKRGTVTEVEDPAYDTDQPTGFELIMLTLELDDPKREISLEAAFCRHLLSSVP